jgi:hypothetical protein
MCLLTRERERDELGKVEKRDEVEGCRSCFFEPFGVVSILISFQLLFSLLCTWSDRNLPA